MKVAPLHRVFSKSGHIESIIVHTGQHYDERMSQVFFDQLGLPKPHHFLGIGGGSHTEQTARIMLAFEQVLDAEKPDLVIVVGDVNSTVACALTAVKKQIKVAHVEAGLRSGDRRMPEEINRIVTDAISDLLFVSEQSGIDNLLAEGISRDRIHFVGNIMIDSLVHILPQSDLLDINQIIADNRFQNTSDSGLPSSDSGLPSSDSRLPSPVFGLPSPVFGLPSSDSGLPSSDSGLPSSDSGLPSPVSRLPSPVSRLPSPDSRLPSPVFGLLTMHRPSNVDSKESLQKILAIVKNLTSEIAIIFAVHPRTQKNLEKFGLLDELQTIPNVMLTQPLGYLEFIRVMKEARLVITDSGGIQEETTWLRVPCITFRESTERPSTVTHGSNTLIKDLDVEEAVRQSLEILHADVRSSHDIPPLWDGHTAERIVEVLRSQMTTTLRRVNG